MVDARLVQRVLEVFAESVTCLDPRVQSCFSLRSVDRGPDAVVSSRDQFGIGSRFNEALVNAFFEQLDGPCTQKRIASSLLAHIESRFQTYSDGDHPIFEVLHDVAVS